MLVKREKIDEKKCSLANESFQLNFKKTTINRVITKMTLFIVKKAYSQFGIFNIDENISISYSKFYS